MPTAIEGYAPELDHHEHDGPIDRSIYSAGQALLIARDYVRSLSLLPMKAAGGAL